MELTWPVGWRHLVLSSGSLIEEMAFEQLPEWEGCRHGSQRTIKLWTMWQKLGLYSLRRRFWSCLLFTMHCFCFSGSVLRDHWAHGPVSLHWLPLPKVDALGSDCLCDQLHISLSQLLHSDIQWAQEVKNWKNSCEWYFSQWCEQIRKTGDRKWKKAEKWKSKRRVNWTGS